jgi:hypothetical protein
MQFAPKPHHLLLQRYAHRFWNTANMMEILSIHHGNPQSLYPRTWQWRTLIAVHRQQNTASAYRKGYGPDWKGEIKGDLLEYAKSGKLPFQALELGAQWLREAERKVWIERQTDEQTISTLRAAE